MIMVSSFGILTPVKLCYFFIFSLKSYLGLMIRVKSPSELDLLFIGTSSSHDLDRELNELIELTQFF
jgi:hypothetical protein